MSIAAVRDYFAQFGMADKVLEFSTSSATVELDRKSTRLNSSHNLRSRMPSSA